MEYLKSLMIICLLICLFSIASVVASEVNETVIANGNQLDNEIFVDSEDIREIGAIEDNKLNLSTGTFSDLANEIDNSDFELNLTKDYICDENEVNEYKSGILLNKKIVINGNNHTLNANGLSRIFNITASNLILKNINFINGKLPNSVLGRSSGLLIYGSNNLIENCNFFNNSCFGLGSAICSQGSNNTIKNCDFINNFANGDGGAIYVMGDSNNILNCNFINNTCGPFSNGGAIYLNRWNNIIFNSSFLNNKAGDYGGAIYLAKYNNHIYCSSFENNVAGVTYGGQICVKEGNNIFEYNSFIDFKGYYKGIDSSYSTNVFNFNWWGSNKGPDQSILSSIAKKPTIWLQTNLTILSEKVIKNEYSKFVSIKLIPNLKNTVINEEYIKLLSLPVNYEVNTGNISDCNVGEDALLLINDKCGLYDINLGATVNNEEITRSITINVCNPSFADLKNNINNSSIDGNTLILSNDYEYDESVDFNYTNGISIDSQITIDGQGHIIDGKNKAYIFKINADNVVLKNITFINSIFGKSDTGSITWNGKNGVFSNCTFINATSYSGSFSWGSMIYWNGDNGSIINSTFINSSLGITGGSLYCKGFNVTIVDSTFINNSVCNGGGAVSIYKANSNIKNCNFINNFRYKNQNGGGAVYYDYNNKCYNHTILNSIFVNNTSFNGYGGAVATISKNTNIINSTFINNSAFSQGSGAGALYVDGRYSKVLNCIFMDNFANTTRTNAIGGAIYWDEESGLINNSIFINNVNKGTGANAIYWSGKNNTMSFCILLDTSDNANYIVSRYSTHEIISLNNWWGNTIDNYSIRTSKIDDGIIFDRWHYLNILSDEMLIYGKNNKITIDLTHLTLYDGTLLSEPIGGFPEITLNVSSINGSSVNNCTLHNGIAEFNFVPTTKTTGSLTITYYNIRLTKYFDFEVEKNPSKLYINVQDIEFGQPADISVMIFENATGNMTLFINNKNYTSEIKKGLVSFNIENLTPGVYNFEVIYDGDENYLNSSIKSAFSVLKVLDDKIDFENIIEDSSNFKIRYLTDANGNFTLFIGNHNFTSQLVNGSAQFNLENYSGEHNVLVSYSGDDKYESFSKYLAITIKSKLKSLNITINDAVFNGENKQLVFDFPEDATGTITLTIDNKSYVVDVSKSHKIELPDLIEGSYEYNITYSGDEKYASFKTNASVTIKSKVNEFNVDSNPSDNTQIIVNLPKDATGNVTIVINGDNYTFDIEDGNVTIELPGLPSGIYNYTLIYSGDEKYDRIVTNNSIMVKNVVPTIESENMTINYGEEKLFEVIFYNDEGLHLANKYIVFLVNGDEYAVKTDSKGLAVLNISGFKPGTYDITSINTKTDETKINTLVVNAVEPQLIDEKDIIIPSLDNTSSDGTVSLRLPSDATGTITLNINGKNYEFKVVNGVANVKVPELANGGYYYTIIYSGDGKYSSFTKTGSVTINKHVAPVNTLAITLTLKKVNVKKSAKKLTIKATLKVNGKVVKGKIIKFKFNKKSYKARTNVKGVAKITVKKSVLKKLKKGKKVTYTATYDKITKKITVKVK